MDGNQGEKDCEPKVNELWRHFSSELEARTSPNAASDQLARIAVEDRWMESSRNEELADLRRHFEPLKIAE